MPAFYVQPGEMESPLRFVMAVFEDQAAATAARHALVREGVVAEDIFVFHARYAGGSSALTLYELGDGHAHPVVAARQPQRDASARDEAAPKATQRTMVLVYVATAEDQRHATTLLHAAHGYLLDAEVDFTSADQ